LQVLEPVKLNYVTPEMIQDIVQKAWADSKIVRSKVFALDCNYMYSFYPEDIPYVQKYTDKIRVEYEYNKARNDYSYAPLMHAWHGFLEEWVIDKYVTILDKRIKPIQINRALDRLTSEFVGKLTRSFAGEDFNTMPYAAVGDGADPDSNPSPNDTDLLQSGGGALSIEGHIFYSVALYPKSMQSCKANESGIFDREKPGTGASDVNVIDDLMGDHSIFDEEIEHEQGEDALGVSTTVFFCSG
jgi:hypothetical protein